jgi:hypothetical protein
MAKQPSTKYLTHKSMTAHFPNLVQTLKYNVAQIPSLSEMLRSCTCVFNC